MKVTANPDGTIQVQRIQFTYSVVSMQTVITFEAAFVEVEPGLFLEATGNSKDIIAFLQHENGAITHMYFSGFPPEAWVRLAPYESPGISITLIQIGYFAGLVVLALFSLIEFYALWIKIL
ncbi:MAG: hypothetical protein Q6361_09270 [Candidatus Hermodarchaeota archaeon]|nr:hypothetical protein [Candidatus Hermodarchaeota archaeon]